MMTNVNLLEHRTNALQQYSSHPILYKIKILKHMQFDVYSNIIDYLGEIQHTCNTTLHHVFHISWVQISPNIVFPLVAIIKKYITSNIQMECINPSNYNIKFQVNMETIDPIFHNCHIFPHNNALSLRDLEW